MTLFKKYFFRKNKNALEQWIIEQGVDHQNACFMQFDGPTIKEIPEQGIKLHISIKDYYDYIEILDRLIPVLKTAGATFKVVRPTSFERFYNIMDSQRGKFITIYNAPFDVIYFLKETSDILLENDCIKLSGELQLCGRIFGRFGSNVAKYVIDKYGNPYYDDRNVPFPPFIDGISLRDFVEYVQIWESNEELELFSNSNFELLKL